MVVVVGTGVLVVAVDVGRSLPAVELKRSEGRQQTYFETSHNE